MFFRKNNDQVDPLTTALAKAMPASIRLFAELVEDGSGTRRPLLIASPTGHKHSAWAAGDIAAAGADMGYADLRLMDLRAVSQGQVISDDSLARPVKIFCPPGHLKNNSDKFRNWLYELTGSTDLSIVLCSGVLNPGHWSEDPAAWGKLNPKVLLVVAEGIHTEPQVAAAVSRLRRTGMEIVGGILVTQKKWNAKPKNLTFEKPKLPILKTKNTAG